MFESCLVIVTVSEYFYRNYMSQNIFPDFIYKGINFRLTSASGNKLCV